MAGGRMGGGLFGHIALPTMVWMDLPLFGRVSVAVDGRATTTPWVVVVMFVEWSPSECSNGNWIARKGFSAENKRR